MNMRGLHHGLDDAIAEQPNRPSRPSRGRQERFSSFREERVWSAVRTSNHTNVYLETLEVRQEWIPFEPSPLDKNVTQKQCGLCELFFPADALPGSTVRSSIRNWREQRVQASCLPEIECNPRTTGAKYKFSHAYDTLPLCAFCNQFFTTCAKIDTDEQGHPLLLSPTKKPAKLANNEPSGELPLVVEPRETGGEVRVMKGSNDLEEEVDVNVTGGPKDVWKYKQDCTRMKSRQPRPKREKHVEGSMFPSRPYSARSLSCATQTERSRAREGDKSKRIKKKKKKKKRAKKMKQKQKNKQQLETEEKCKGTKALPKPKWAVETEEGEDAKKRARRPQILFHACLALHVRKKVEHFKMLECKEKLRNPPVLKLEDS